MKNIKLQLRTIINNKSTICCFRTESGKAADNNLNTARLISISDAQGNCLKRFAEKCRSIMFWPKGCPAGEESRCPAKRPDLPVGRADGGEYMQATV